MKVPQFATYLLLSSFFLFTQLPTPATSLEWSVYKYYVYDNDYFNGLQCSTLTWVDMVLGQGCLQLSTCTHSSNWNFVVDCYDEAHPPAVNSFFSQYHLITKYNGDGCTRNITGYTVFGANMCLQDVNDDYNWWECERDSGIMQSYNGLFCDDGLFTDETAALPTTPENVDLNLAGCISSASLSGVWWRLTCNASRATPGWQLISYSNEEAAYEQCNIDFFLGYQFYYTDYCLAAACVFGNDFTEVWSCSDTEPQPFQLVPSHTLVVYYYSQNDYTCSGDPRSTFVWDDACHIDGGHAYAFDHDLSKGTLKLLDDSVLWGSCLKGDAIYTDFLPLTNNKPSKAPMCFYDHIWNHPNTWYQLTDGTLSEGWQTVYHHPTNALSTYIAVDQWWADNCWTRVISEGSSLQASWTCSDSKPVLTDTIQEGLLLLFYSPLDSRCSVEPIWASIMTPDCTNDTISNNAWYYHCNQQSAVSVELDMYACDSHCGTCTSSIIASSSGSGDEKYCYYYDDSTTEYFTMYCSPYNPAWQIVEYYASDTNKPESLLYAEGYYSNTCVDQTDSTGDFFEVWHCYNTSSMPQDYWSNAIYSFKYLDNACTINANWWVSFNPGCVTDTRDGTNWIFGCSKNQDDGAAVMYHCGSSYDNCMDLCTVYELWDGQLKSNFSKIDYCYSDYYNDGTFFQLFCGSESGYQVIEQFASNTNNTSYLMIRKYSDYTDECNSRGLLGWNYQTTHMVEEWYCVTEEPNAYSDWSEAYVLSIFGDGSSSCDISVRKSVTSFNPSCVNHEALPESFLFNCSNNINGARLLWATHDGTDCEDTLPSVNTWIESDSPSSAEHCWYSTEENSYFTLVCNSNPAYQTIEKYAASSTVKDALIEVAAEWSTDCVEFEAVVDGFLTKMYCATEFVSPESYWDNPIVTTYYVEECGAQEPASIIIMAPECVNSDDGTKSSYFSCIASDSAASVTFHQCSSSCSDQKSCSELSIVSSTESLSENCYQDSEGNYFSQYCNKVSSSSAGNKASTSSAGMGFPGWTMIVLGGLFAGLFLSC
ncbi:hypothetical protein Pelo_462 [Pelomyxa schiedti]|nr:hypothetical protein Pelo_462 [Pelomyxa schiedti]